MKFASGDIVKLLDKGDDDFVIVLTKESIDKQDLLKDSDYVLKKVYSEDLLYVMEADVYKSYNNGEVTPL